MMLHFFDLVASSVIAILAALLAVGIALAIVVVLFLGFALLTGTIKWGR